MRVFYAIFVMFINHVKREKQSGISRYKENETPGYLKMKISVITATYNSEKNISGCLQSVADQTHKNIEHFVNDGASCDNTPISIKKQPIGFNIEFRTRPGNTANVLIHKPFLVPLKKIKQ